MAVCPVCYHPFPKGTDPDECPRCGHELKPGAKKEQQAPAAAAPAKAEPAEEEQPLTKEEKKKLKQKKKQERKIAIKKAKGKFDPKKIKPPKIKKIRDPTVMVKQARARFFMVIAGFMISIMVFVLIFKNLNRYIHKWFPKKPRVTQEDPSSGNTAGTSDDSSGSIELSDNDASSGQNTGRDNDQADAVSDTGTGGQSTDTTTAKTGRTGSTDSGTVSTGSAGSGTTGTGVGNQNAPPPETGGSSGETQAEPAGGADTSDIETKLKRGKRLYFDKQYRACLDLMDDILEIDEFNDEALNYKNLSEAALSARGEL